MPGPVQFILNPTAFDGEHHRPTVWIFQQPGVDLPQTRERLVRRVLAARLSLPPAALDLTKDPHGRPALSHPAPLDFSLSHCPGALAVAVHPGPAGRIGVDVEPLRPDTDPLLLARDHFTPAESARLAALPATDRLHAFYDVWTAKEALSKALGHGFSFGLDSIETAPGPDGHGLRLSRLAGSSTLAAGWCIAHHRLPGLLIAVAIG